MDDVNTYKVNNLLQGLSDSDLVAELTRRGFEVTKWKDDRGVFESEDLEDWGLDVWDNTDVWNENKIIATEK